MTAPRVERYCELALADCSILIGEPLTEREARIVRHCVDLMDAIATGVHLHNLELVARLARCREECPEPPEEMSVVA